MFIDTHCHIDSYERHSGESLSSLLERLPHDADPKVALPEAFIHVACDPKDFEYARELSEKYPNVYAAYGIHPEYVLTETAEDEARMMEFLKHPKCVACGEFGLDNHYDLEHRAEQVKLFERHLQLGIESGKPLVLHLREADEDALAVLRNADLQGRNVHVHCFTGTPEFAGQLLELGASKNSSFFVGFTGIVTFKNAQNVRDAAALVPLDQMLLETDSPYMAPIPYRGKNCHSGYIPYIAEKLAEVKNVSIEEIYKRCRENTRRCYGI
ncbi:MAG: TatD family hydrolase [Fibrobacter sp.]|nr:TatD family hydrolase [Fibrobacter sp.]MBR2470538.1 TatD family hydrolase [Fibrobacter sp.]